METIHADIEVIGYLKSGFIIAEDEYGDKYFTEGDENYAEIGDVIEFEAIQPISELPDNVHQEYQEFLEDRNNA